MISIDRSYTEQVLFRVAICAFTYYPNKALDEPGYTVDEDVVWCLTPIENRLSAPERDSLRDDIRMLITEPLADRRPFIARLGDLADDES